MTVTDQQLRAIAFLAAAARPHGARRWDEHGIVANLAKVRDRSLASLTVAALLAAEDRNADSPGVIPTPGPHWRDAHGNPTPSRTPTPAAADRCSTCSLHRDVCRARWNDDHAFTPATHDQRSNPHRVKTIADALRAEITPTRDPAAPQARPSDPRADHARAALRPDPEEPTP